MEFALTSSTQITLVPDVINEIVLELTDCPITAGSVLKVGHHCPNNPWQILTNFLYISPTINKILLPIVSLVNYTIHPNEIIDYVQPINFQETVNTLNSGNKKCK